MTDTVGASVEPQSQSDTASPGAVTPEVPSTGGIFDGLGLESIYDDITKDETNFAEETYTGEVTPGEDESDDTDLLAEDADETDDDQSQTEDAEQQDDQDAQPEESAAIERPQSWSPENDALWKQLPPEAQQIVAKRESEAQQQISRMGNDLSAYRPLGELIAQNRAMFERNGVDPTNGIAALLQAQQQLEMDPVSGLATIAGRFGLNRVQLAQALVGRSPQGANGQGQGTVDPSVLQLNSEVTGLKQQLAEARRETHSWREQQEQAAQQQTDRDVQKWSEGKPYFGEARQMMGNLIMASANQGQVLSLDDAYDQAIHAIPTLRAKVQAEVKARDADARKKSASEAKRRGSVNTGSTRPTQAVPNGKWDDLTALSADFDRIAASG
jgi:hypothetical protein